MKNLIKVSLYAVLAVSPVAIAADAMAPTAAPVADPTITFFNALSQCTPGDYQEQNILSTSAGDFYLQHEVIGLDEEGYCHAVLQTPDSRRMQCYFDPYDLADLNTPKFLSGIAALDADTKSKEGVATEHQWSQLKDQNCSFDHN
jgi:hypothetical protein